MCKNKRNISFYKQFLDFFDVLTPLKIATDDFGHWSIRVICQGFFYLFASSLQLIMHRKRNFHFYRILITLLFCGLTPTVLLADPTPPPPPDEPIFGFWF